MTDFSKKKVWGVAGVVLLGVLGMLYWWLTRPVIEYDDWDALRRRAELTMKAEQPFQPQMDEAKIKNEVKSALIQSLSGVSQTDVEVISVQSKEWPDACLGVQREGQLCAQVITPGYQVKALAASKVYDVHTDQALEQIVIIDSNGEVIN